MSSEEPTGEKPRFDLETYGDPPPASTGPRMLVPLFMVPLLIVVVVVGIFFGVSALIGDPETPSELVERVASGGVNDRWQAAASLSDLAAKTPEELADPALRASLRATFDRASDARIKSFLARVFAAVGDQEAAPLVLHSLNQLQGARVDGGFPGRAEETGRAFVDLIMCLGELGEQSVAEELLELRSDPDVGVRKAVAFALGQLYSGPEEGSVPDAVPQGLLKLHEDEDPWVRMNAALSLAKLGLDDGLATLEYMLSRDNLKKDALSFPDEGAYTIATYDPAFDPIRFALSSIHHLARVSPRRDEMAAPQGPLVKSLLEFVENEPNPELRRQGQQVLAALTGTPDAAEKNAASEQLRDG